MLRCTEVSQPIDAMGHSRPGPTSGRPANVCYASDRYRNGEPLKPTRRADSVEKLKNGVEAKIRDGSVATSIRQ
jgi:hypothetical protein